VKGKAWSSSSGGSSGSSDRRHAVDQTWRGVCLNSLAGGISDSEEGSFEFER